MIKTSLGLLFTEWATASSRKNTWHIRSPLFQLLLQFAMNASKKMFGERLKMPLDFDFFEHPVYPYGLKEDLIVRLELYLDFEILQQHTRVPIL